MATARKRAPAAIPAIAGTDRAFECEAFWVAVLDIWAVEIDVWTADGEPVAVARDAVASDVLPESVA